MTVSEKLTRKKLFADLEFFHKADFYIELTELYIELYPTLMDGRNEKITKEVERLKSLGINCNVIGRKYKKIEIVL